MTPNRARRGLYVVVAIAGFLVATSLAARVEEAKNDAAYAQSAAEDAAASAEQASDRIDDLETRLGYAGY